MSVVAGWWDNRATAEQSTIAKLAPIVGNLNAAHSISGVMARALLAWCSSKYKKLILQSVNQAAYSSAEQCTSRADVRLSHAINKGLISKMPL